MKTYTEKQLLINSLLQKSQPVFTTHHWVSGYIGIPYRNYNCFQLVQKILKDVYKVELKDPPTLPSNDIQTLSKAIDDLFNEYLDPQELQEPMDGCMVLMHGARNYNHIGLYLDILGDGYVIHAYANAKQSVCHKITDLSKYGFTVEGFYAWL